MNICDECGYEREVLIPVRRLEGKTECAPTVFRRDLCALCVVSGSKSEAKPMFDPVRAAIDEESFLGFREWWDQGVLRGWVTWTSV